MCLYLVCRWRQLRAVGKTHPRMRVARRRSKPQFKPSSPGHPARCLRPVSPQVSPPVRLLEEVCRPRVQHFGTWISRDGKPHPLFTPCFLNHYFVVAYRELNSWLNAPGSFQIADLCYQIYERGCASITNCVDLWASYCSFKMETTHTPHLVRE